MVINGRCHAIAFVLPIVGTWTGGPRLCQADKKVTPCAFLPWVDRVGGRPPDGRRPVVRRPTDGRRTSSGRTSGRCACRQRRRKKNHLIEAAPFGRLDQMWRTIVFWGGLRGLCPPSQKPTAPQPKLCEKTTNQTKILCNFFHVTFLFA